MSNDNKNLRTYYVHGKDNIPFHTTIFPALVMGLNNNYRLPDYIVSSAYVNLNNEKMSKSKGNLISANELLEQFDMDTLRFYFTFNGPETKDTNCSIEEIIQVQMKGEFAKAEKYVTDYFVWTTEMEKMAENIKQVSKTLNGKVESPLAEKLVSE